MTQLRAKRSNPTPLKRAAQLLEMRDETARNLGERYNALVELYRPAIRAALPSSGCTIAAATRVIEQLGPAGDDPAVKRLVTCSAIELALAS